MHGEKDDAMRAQSSYTSEGAAAFLHRARVNIAFLTESGRLRGREERRRGE